jgi:hypothetical protein
MIRKVAASAFVAVTLLVATQPAAWAQSPQMPLAQETLNAPCIGVGKVGIQSIVALINIGVQDIPILTSQQQQQCTDNSDPLSHIVDQLPILSGNG